MIIRSEYINALKAIYNSEKCGCSGCRKADQCGAKGPIAGPKEPFIGSDFGTGRFPRLVILSLDPGSIDADNCCGVDRVEDGRWCPTTRGGKTRHWWRSLQLIYSVLGDKPLNEASDTEIAAAVNWASLMNSARCTQNKPRRREADNTLFNNCMEFVKEELQILKPEILFTQGDRAWDVINDYTNDGLKEPVGGNTDSYIRRFEIAGQPCRHVHFYHPSYLRGYARQHNDLVLSGLLKKRLINDV